MKGGKEESHRDIENSKDICDIDHKLMIKLKKTSIAAAMIIRIYTKPIFKLFENFQKFLSTDEQSEMFMHK